MNPILQYFLKALVSAGGLFISVMVILIRQLCVESDAVELILDRSKAMVGGLSFKVDLIK
jgi:hypothetical protein